MRRLTIVSRAAQLKPATESAGCVKCDSGMEVITHIHHKDGSVCSVARRNFELTGIVSPKDIAPLGRYDPSKDEFRK